MPDRDGLFDDAEREVLEAVMVRRRDVRGNRFTSAAISDDIVNRIIDAERVKTILGATAPLQLVAYLCLGHVDRFEQQPELERLGWEERKRRDQVVHRERFTDC